MAAVIFSGGRLAAQEVAVIERGGIKMHVYSAKPENFQVTSVLLEGEKDAVLIDAQFSNEEASRVVDMIKRTGKHLTTIFISQADPDFYFGLGLIAEHFPQAKIYSTAQTAYLIDVTKEPKLEIWGPQLKEHAPTRFVVPTALEKDYFMLEDTRIEIKQRKDDPDYSYLWIPSIRTILGGVYLWDDMHLWTADPQFESYTGNWSEALEEMESLNPEYAIPTHFVLGRSDMKAEGILRFTKQYLKDFKREAAEATDSKQLIAAMKSLYPEAVGEPLLELGAKVVKGEMSWKKVYSYPLIGRKAEVRFGNSVIERYATDHKRMTIVGKSGDLSHVFEEVEYMAVPIVPGIYMLYWYEPGEKVNVVVVEDYNAEKLYTNIGDENGVFIHPQGTIRIVD